MARYIDADKADVERISCFYGAECRIEDVKEWLDEQPTADVQEVVRCKDCKHATFYACKNDACYRGIICEYQIGTDDENFFCSYGERRNTQ